MSLENTVIKQVTEMKFFGVFIYYHLTGKHQTSLVSKKIPKSIGIKIFANDSIAADIIAFCGQLTAAILFTAAYGCHSTFSL